MQTIQVNLRDELYHTLKKQGIDIQDEIKEYLSFLINDNYPTIDTDEAKRRVEHAYKNYYEDDTTNLNLVDDGYWDSLDNILEKK